MRLEVVLSLLLFLLIASVVSLFGFGLYRVSTTVLRQAQEERRSAPVAEPSSEPTDTPPAPEPSPAEPAAAEPSDAPAESASSEPAPASEPSAPAEATPEPLVLVEPACQSAPRERLRLDALVTDEALARVWLDSFKPFLPAGAKLPAPLQVQGVDVVVLANPPREDQPPRLCLDATQALADDVASRATRPAPEAHGPGAWLVPATGPGTTVAALVAPGLAQAFPSSGPLVAFAASDNLVGFADSADSKAVALVASTLAERISTDSADGCVSEQLLLRVKTGWAPFKPPPRVAAAPELRAYAAQTLECRLALTVSLLDFAREQTRDAGVVDYELPDLELTEALPAKDGAHRLVSLAPDTGAQLLPTVDVVEIDLPSRSKRASLPWAIFQRLAKKQLKPLELAHRKVPQTWVLESGLRAAEVASVPGLRLSPIPQAQEDAAPVE